MSTKDIIKKSILENFTSDISNTRLLIALGLTAILALYIFYVYRITRKSEFFSSDFSKTLALISVITAAIVLAMQSNLVISLGMVGALSIVRFRNAIKDPVDLVFLFWAISIGIICGAGLYEIAFITSFIVTVLLLVLDYLPTPRASTLLVINSSSANMQDILNETISKYCKTAKTKSKNISSHGMDIIMEIKCHDEEKLLLALSSVESVTNVSILTHSGEKRF